MLNQIRENVQHPALKVLLGLIIVVFIFFFGGGMGGNRAPSVATVNGVEISQAAYNETYAGLLNLYEQITRQPVTAEMATQMGLGARALDIVIDRALLLEYADKMDVEVSEEEIKSAIRAQEAFYENGRFSNDRFLQILGVQGITPGRYKELKRSELLLAKAEESIKALAVVGPAEIEKEFRDQNTKLVAEYATFSPDNHSALVEATDEKLADFHAAEGEKFRTEEKRSARYIAFRIDDFVEAAKVSEEELQSEYRIRAFKFVAPETVKASHILIRVEAGADAEAWRKADEAATALRTRIAEGEDFAALAKKESQDSATKANGGDLGTFGRGVMPPEFEQAVFALKADEVSEPVRTSLGYHLIRLDERNIDRQKPLDEVRDELLALVKREKARELSFQAADNTLMDLEDKQLSWDALPEGFEVQTTAVVALRQQDGSIPAVEGFVDTLFNMPAASPGELIETPEGSFLLSVAERVESQIPALEDIRGQVEARFRVVEGKNLARKAAEEFAAKAKADWQEATKALGRDIQATETLSKEGANVAPLGYSPDAKEALFEAPEVGRLLETPFEIGSEFAVLRISAVTEPDMSKLEEEREAIQTQLLPKLRDAELEKKLKELRDGADIEIQETLLR